MAFDTSQALSIQAARTINVGRGDPTPVEALYTDGFESYPLGNFESTGDVFSWSLHPRVAASADRAFSGSQSVKFSFGPGELSGEMRFLLDKKYTELWFRYKMWVPSNYFHRVNPDPERASNNKGLMMLWGDSYSGYSPTASLHFLPFDNGSNGDSYLYPAWRVNGPTALNFFDPNDLSGGDPLTASPVGIVQADRGTWVDWVMHFKVSTNPIAYESRAAWDPVNDNGAVQVWKNGNLLLDITNAHNYYGGGASDPGGVGDGWNFGYILGAANSGWDELTEIFIDDFAIAETAAGVGFSV